MSELKLLFLQIAVVLAAAWLVSAAARRLRQPAVVGEMAAGLLLGPSLLGRISPAALNQIFPATGLGPLYVLSQVGLVLFMFLVGVQMRPSAMRNSAKSVIGASMASIAAPFVCGAALAAIFYSRLGGDAPRLPFVLFVGTAMGITAFPVLARILADRNLMNSRPGLFAISCAAVDDLSAWCLLAIITVIARHSAGGSVAGRFLALGLYIAVMMILIRPALRRLLPAGKHMGPGSLTGILIFLLASAWTTEALEVHALFGAFLAGVVMPRDPELEIVLQNRIESLTVVLLLPLFFAYTGLRTNIGLLNSAELWLICVLILLVAIASKLLVSSLAIRLSGVTWREALTVGVMVNTRGLVELVILNVGLDLHILSPAVFSMMVIMALATTLMTAPLLDWIGPTATFKGAPDTEPRP